MKDFLIGLGLGLVGLIGVIAFGVMGALGEAAEVSTPGFIIVLFWLCLFIMFVGPGYFWIYLPLSRRFSSRPHGRT